MSTVSRMGLIGSVTIACSVMLVRGRRKPARRARCEEWPATANATFPALSVPRLVTTPVTRLPLLYVRLHLAVLNDVDAEVARAARERPVHRVVTGNPGAALDESADDRHTCVQIDSRQQSLNVRRRQHFRIDAIEVDGVRPAPHDLELVRARRDVDQPALAQHDVEIQIVPQRLVEPERMIEELGARRVEVVRACYLGVPARITAADPAFFEQRDVANAVLAGEVVRGGQAVPAAADDNDIVRALRSRNAPEGLPVPVRAQCMSKQGETAISLHGEVC